MDGSARLTKRADTDGEGVWSCPPDAGVKLAEMIRRRRRQSKPGLRGEPAISRNTIAQGMLSGKIINKINGKSDVCPPLCRDTQKLLISCAYLRCEPDAGIACTLAQPFSLLAFSCDPAL